MKALVTGGAGFIGSHLAASLVGQSWDVTILDNLHRGRLSHIEQALRSPRVDFVAADIRDYDAVVKAADGVDIVYHLAAQSNVLGASKDPNYSFTTNVLGTFNVLKAACETGVQRVVFSSSREVYGEPETLPVSEQAALAPKNWYGASKVAGEAYCRAWQQSADLDCLVLRFANVYGPGDRDRVIPLWLGQARDHQDLTVYGGTQVLDFLWVGDAVEALVRAASCENRGPINVGSGRGTTIRELGSRLLQLTGSRSTLRYVPARREEVTHFVADVRKMTDVLGLWPQDDPLGNLPAVVQWTEPVVSPRRGALTAHASGGR